MQIICLSNFGKGGGSMKYVPIYTQKQKIEFKFFTANKSNVYWVETIRKKPIISAEIEFDGVVVVTGPISMVVAVSTRFVCGGNGKFMEKNEHVSFRNFWVAHQSKFSTFL
jgi:hypothetical protein